MTFAQTHAITDVCVLVADVERSTRFYVDRLGFRLLHRAPGFADFAGAGTTLAVWEADHVRRTTGLPTRALQDAHQVMIAVHLPTPADVDAVHAELTANGVVFSTVPADYPWNARSCYFAGPDGELWELYAWHEGGAAGKLD